jgi:predicted phage terminase large subunit-like protein
VKKRVSRKRLRCAKRPVKARSLRADPGVVDALVAAARDDLVTFTQLCFYILKPTTKLLMNWHIKAIAHQLERIRLGQQKRLIVAVPPRHLKSIITSVAYPAFILGQAPSKTIIVASYAADLAIKHGNDFRAIIESDMYRKVFPNVHIAKNTESEVTTTAGGCRIATSVDGPITGRGCDIAVIDDPLKPGEALSDARRERVNNWYYQTFLSRLDDPRNAAIILVMQRLHENDLAGTLLRSPEEWFYLKFPAISTCDETIAVGSSLIYERREGEALHVERMPLEELEKRREEVGSDTWQAQYQQEPVPPGGYMIRRTWVQRYQLLPPRKSGSRIIQSIDTATKAGSLNDYSVITTWLIQDHCYWLIDVARKRLEYPYLKAFVLEQAEKHRPDEILIEDAGTGSALVQELRFTRYNVIGVRPMNDKLTRAQIVAAKFESGKIFLPCSAPWLAELEAELFSFPQSRHDDQVDSITQALAHEISGYDTSMRWARYL